MILADYSYFLLPILRSHKSEGTAKLDKKCVNGSIERWLRPYWAGHTLSPLKFSIVQGSSCCKILPAPHQGINMIKKSS